MTNTKSNRSKAKKPKENIIDSDHFTVFKLKEGWEKVMSDTWSPEEIQKFKERQELLSTIPLELRKRTKLDESYREGWVDAVKWAHQEMRKIFHSDDDDVTNGSYSNKKKFKNIK